MSTRRLLRQMAWVGLGVLTLLATVRLTAWPQTWFDEGSHLHVPKALVLFGVYADYSSEGFRYFGPTIGVGPTVLVPVAASLAVFGIGLLQARAVMALYLLGFALVFHALARRLAGPAAAFVATALVVTAPGAAVLEHGRQVLGEVPGAFFLVSGLLLWFRNWNRGGWGALLASGTLLGLAAITKHVYLLALAPALMIAWLVNAAHYRLQSHRVFLVPGAVCAATFAAWQVAVLGLLGPATFAENSLALREMSAGAAFVFDTTIARRSASQIVGANGYFGLALPALLYVGWRSLHRTTREQQWGVVWLMAAANLGWFVFASTGWMRYAFPGLVLAALCVARFVRDLLRGIAREAGAATRQRRGLALSLGLWLVAAVALPLGQVVTALAATPRDTARATAEWLTRCVPASATVETWEPELGFLTDHRYHFPPQSLLVTAVDYVWHGGPPPRSSYEFRVHGVPDYVVVGAFAAWVGLYGQADLERDYAPIHEDGPWTVWRRAGVLSSDSRCPQEEHHE